jgi:hypothetical protein
MNAAPGSRQEGPLAMICGGGSLPLAVAESVTKGGRRVVLFGLRGSAERATIERFPHHWIYIGQLGRFFRTARAEGCREIVFIGSLVRPSIWQVHPNLWDFRFLMQALAAFRGGDNHILSSMGRLLEGQGFILRGAHEVAPEILVPEGALGANQPSERDQADSALGIDYLRATGQFDVGQAVVVAGKHIVAVEAIEGTDHMLARVAEMRANGRLRSAAGTGVMVKAPKPGQDRRFDLPSIGPQTVENVARAGLAGIAVVAGSTIIAEPDEMVKAADRAKIFIVGLPAGTGR